MMNKQEFFEYVKDNIKHFLPASYDNANIFIEEATKRNDIKLSGLHIRKSDEVISPIIYLDRYYTQYEEGESADALVGEIANLRIENDEPELVEQAMNCMDYQKIKDKLQIKLCDPELNRELLQSHVYTLQGDYAAMYQVNLEERGHDIASMGVTQELFETWGIDMNTLHKDALLADYNRKPTLIDLGELFAAQDDKEPVNLLESPEHQPEFAPFSMYRLTNEKNMNGASMILQENLLRQCSKIIGGDFYVLPSSVHETLLVPEQEDIDVAYLTHMVRAVNSDISSVPPADILSDKVQYYDSKNHILENAEKRQERLDKARDEMLLVKGGKSIHQRLNEKREHLKGLPTGKSEHLKTADMML